MNIYHNLTWSILNACSRIAEDQSFFTKINNVLAKTRTSPAFTLKFVGMVQFVLGMLMHNKRHMSSLFACNLYIKQGIATFY